jgi:uncharacterized membrane protein
MTKTEKLVSAAMAGLLGAAVLAAPGSAEGKKGHKGLVLAPCYGINKCSGHGQCSGKGHECAGKNSCKGQGWIKVPKEACEDIQGGSLTKPTEAETPAPAPAPTPAPQ